MQPGQLPLRLSNGCLERLRLIQQLLFPLSSLDDEVSLQGLQRAHVCGAAGQQIPL